MSTPQGPMPPAPPSPGTDADVVLLAVTGMSPAVLTETVWALAHEPEPVIPSRVIAITTTEGRRQIEDQLFQPLPRFDGATAWDALRSRLREAGLPVDARLRFGTTGDDVRVITAVEPATQRSLDLPDIRTPADNEAAADFLLEQVRGLVENPDIHLIASVAGGRKTMGALLYACMTLAGRESDRLTHVLVNEPFDTVRGFFFPGQPGGSLTDRQGSLITPSTARVELADVPFVPLRNLFVRELGRKAGTFSRLLEACREHVRQSAGETIRLAVDQSRTEIEVDGARLRLGPREHLVLLFLATRAKRSEAAFPSQKHAIDPLNHFRLQVLETAPPSNFSDWRHGDNLRAALDEQDLRRALSSLRIRLRAAGPATTRLAACLPAKGQFGLAVPSPMIHLKP